MSDEQQSQESKTDPRREVGRVPQNRQNNLAMRKPGTIAFKQKFPYCHTHSARRRDLTENYKRP